MSDDVFPLLDTSELAICLQSCDFSLATEESISRPTSKWMITLYKQIIDSFMGVSADAAMIREGGGQSYDGNQVGAEHRDYNEDDSPYSDTLQVLVLNKVCYKFFQNIGVTDFNILDLYKPDAQRTRRLLSAVVNYARFREERMFDCNRFISQTEALLGQLRSRFDDFNLLQQQIKQYEDDEKLVRTVVGVNDGDELKALEANNRNIEVQLKKLTQIQETLSIDYNNYKGEKQKLLKELESLGFQIVELESEREKLQRHSEANIEGLEKIIEELKDLLHTNKTKLSKLRSLQENLNISKLTFQRVIEELYDVLRIVTIELQEAHKKELGLEELKQQLTIRQDKMSSLLSSGVLTKVSLLQDQLDSSKTKLEELVQKSRTDYEHNSLEIKQLHRKYLDEVVPELQQTESRIENDILSGELKYFETKMQDLQAESQKEVDSVELEYSLLAGHINKYMKSMIENMSSE
ncbi:hypothetical protein HG535_0C02880 [Zygotorulaspora mrakii]|uniref:Kinetochore protein Nuf2 N-terminal domain-containing protein n=1 Tax=Zygotorulaspora mrakii TaxID=42260 RepID=A0A7H9B0B7_ZYGMR|nr:uncharacterized protein HG535_0C02880 [Zygotorulaspora mrakii]QLG71936.1 hypothetical protein HG535_0C02880 [Zygotorulaspora mrakii]